MSPVRFSVGPSGRNRRLLRAEPRTLRPTGEVPGPPGVSIVLAATIVAVKELESVPTSWPHSRAPRALALDILATLVFVVSHVPGRDLFNSLVYVNVFLFGVVPEYAYLGGFAGFPFRAPRWPRRRLGPPFLISRRLPSADRRS